MPPKHIFVLNLIACFLLLAGCGGSEKNDQNTGDSQGSVVDKGKFDGQFVADIRYFDGEKENSGQIFVKNGNYRIEYMQDDQPFYFITYPDSAMVRIIVPEKQGYYELSLTGKHTFPGDPFYSLRNIIPRVMALPDDTVEIEGYLCERTSLKKSGQKTMSYWISPRLDFFIKVEEYLPGGKNVELSNIREVNVADSLLQMPAGYSKMALP